jgi:putative two-component system response regulator
MSPEPKTFRRNKGIPISTFVGYVCKKHIRNRCSLRAPSKPPAQTGEIMEKDRALIMMVDDSRTSLTAGVAVLSASWSVQTALSAAKMFEALEQSKPELILLDVNMPGMTGFEAIQILKKQPETQDIPVIFLTGSSEHESELAGLKLGAVDYITKPFIPELLCQRVATHVLLKRQQHELENYNKNLQHMVDEKTKTIVKLQNKILAVTAEMIESRDGTTGKHIANTQRHLKILLQAAIRAGFWKEQTADWDIELILNASQLHDIGKIAIEDKILRKTEKLTNDEFAEMQQHVSRGVNIIARLQDGEVDNRFLQYAKIFAGFHHEKWDGSGYHLGLAGEEIPLLSRMLTVCDVYDALTADRSYKKAFSHEEAVKIIIEGKGTHFDPTLVSLFEECAEMFRQREEAPQTS